MRSAVLKLQLKTRKKDIETQHTLHVLHLNFERATTAQAVKPHLHGSTKHHDSCAVQQDASLPATQRTGQLLLRTKYICGGYHPFIRRVADFGLQDLGHAIFVSELGKRGEYGHFDQISDAMGRSVQIVFSQCNFGKGTCPRCRSGPRCQLGMPED